MKYVSCEQVEYGLFFIIDAIRSCCIGTNNTDLMYSEYFDGSILDIDKLFNKKNEWRSNLQAGKIYPSCKDCNFLIENDWSNKNIFKTITIAHRTNCSCNCIYCFRNEDKERFNTRKAYNIVPILQYLHDNNFLYSSCCFTLSGGECTEYPNNEFKQIVDLAYQNKYKLVIYSSGINFSEEIQKMLLSGLAQISISVDSGTKETYEKIKRRKTFERVWNNIAVYTSALSNEKESFAKVICKYIILPDINDNEEEFSAFIQQCKKANVNNIYISIEYSWWNNTLAKQMKIDDRLVNFVKYIQSFNRDGLIIKPIEFGINLFKKIDEKKKNDT